MMAFQRIAERYGVPVPDYPDTPVVLQRGWFDVVADTGACGYVDTAFAGFASSWSIRY